MHDQHPANTLRLALDANDFNTVRQLLHPSCRYRVRDELLEGVEAIVASYRDADASARALFDGVEYDSSVVEATAAGGRIEFIDHLTIDNERHTHRCQQTIEVDADGRITAITHIDLPGEREAVHTFLQRHGKA